MKQRATITDVARRAGVSVASASRALNGLSASAATVERVRTAAGDLGYIPDATARALKMGRTLQLSFAVDDIGNPVYVEMMKAVQSVVTVPGYRLMISSTGDADDTIDLLRSLSKGYADGMILSPLRVTDRLVEEVRAAPVPVVVIGRLPEGSGVDTVMTDSARGVGIAVDHLVETGRRRIGFVNGPLDTTPGRARQHGFEATAERLGDRHGPAVAAADFTVAAGYDAARTLLAGHGAPGGTGPGPHALDAVVAANDLLAIGVMHAAHDAGVRVPDDLAVVGMDDTELARVFQPSLTSVSLGSGERGTRAAELLLARLADPQREATTVVVPPALHVRHSTRPPHGRDTP
ncbi:LacI family DNA-binding transcriptional regulator [Cellulomonas sp. ATA003]|uniref:LacI family DNA-binding transcriptional regulator n=1 Tax=Cellulomonas sp. ATA003 TaxID=3073064 RepID=UPI0028735410|nr:LacI family DNA-binding transcriptional regulator [Cellulomonas sp. ATA003]WNB85870.1 LacI family DNA-binding transcriptional regulator [Cellulomonas sp. ATA003]